MSELERRLERIEHKLDQLLGLRPRTGPDGEEIASNVEIAQILAAEDPLAALDARERDLRGRGRGSRDRGKRSRGGRYAVGG